MISNKSTHPKDTPPNKAAEPQPIQKKTTKQSAQAEFKKNVETLLSSDSQAKRLIGLMSLYGRLYYDWTLSSDIIQWRGPIQNLLGVKTNIITGDTFLRNLSMNEYKMRIETLSKSFKERTPFEIEYHLEIGEGLYCLIQENAEILFTEAGIPAKILGSILISPQALSMKSKTKVLVDKETGLMCSSEIEKTLDAAILKGQHEKVYAAYIAISIDKLTNILALSGESGVKKIIRFVTDSLHKAIRENDTIGRLSGNTFGVILYNCDRWGIIAASERLIGNIQEAKIKIADMGTQLTVSSGGAVFPCETFAASEIMSEAHSALADAQNTKGISRFWAPSIIKGGPTTPPKKKIATKGKRRMID